MATLANVVVMMLLLAGMSEFGILADIPTKNPCLDSDYVYEPSPELPDGRFSFPPGFIFGTATSSYQIEGAHNYTYGKGPSIWDRFTHNYPDRILGGGNGDVAIDHYHKFMEDIARMKFMNVDAYRFSLSWPRIIPSGKRSDGVNQQGIDFYHTLLDALIENGMSAKDNATQTLAEALDDDTRVDFYNQHLTSVWRAIKEKQVKVKGYFAWSYADNFEWNEGYTVRFGLYYINYTDVSRHPKHSACWYTSFCNKTRPESSFKFFDLDQLIAARAALRGRRALSSTGRLY
ncbi:Cyanogenic beta-glucosidase (Fragment) [Linum grandiflorum]